MLKIYNPRVKQAAGFLVVLLVLFASAVGLLLSQQSSTVSHAATCGSVYDPLPSWIYSRLKENKPYYVKISKETGVPWEMLAAIHYRESSMARWNPDNGYGIFQFTPPPETYKPGPVSYAEFERQLRYMAKKVQSDYVYRNYPNPASVSTRKLTVNEKDMALIKNTLFSYNGRADVYAKQAAKYGYSSKTTPYEGSPYVMNMFDCKRAGMGIITRDYGSLDGTDTRYGAFTLYARLKGESYWKSLQGYVAVTSIKFSEQPFTDAPTTVSFTVTNKTKARINLGRLKVAVRDPNNANFDFASVENVTLPVGGSYTYKKTRILNGPEGNYTFYIGRYDGETWHYPPFGFYNQPSNTRITKTVTRQPKITSPLTLKSSSTSLHANQTITAGFKIKNYSALKVTVGYIKPAVRDSKGKNLDFPYSPYLVLDPGEEYTYSKARTLPSSGKYHVWIANKRNGYSWSETFPVSATTGLARDFSFNVKDQVTLDVPLSISIPNPHATNLATGKFRVTNYGTTSATVGYIKPAVRDSKGNNFDLPYSPYVKLGPGESYVYDASRELPHAGTYRIWIANKRSGHEWSSTYPASETPGIARTYSTTLKDATTLTSPLRITMANPTAGNSATATFTIKNFGSRTVAVGYIKPAVRDSNNRNLDFPYSPYIRLAPGQEYVYSKSRTLPTADQYRIWIANKRSGHEWSSTFPMNEHASMTRSITYDLHNTARLTSDLSITRSGNIVTGGFKIKNFGTKTVEVGYIKPAVRDSNNRNLDFPYSPYIRLAPGQEYVYSKSRTLPTADQYRIWIANKRSGHEWSSTYPISQDSSLDRSVDLTL